MSALWYNRSNGTEYFMYSQSVNPNDADLRYVQSYVNYTDLQN